MMGSPMATIYPSDPLVLDGLATCEDVLVSIGWCRNVTESDLQILSQLLIRAPPEVPSKEMSGSWALSLGSHLGEQIFTHQPQKALI